VGLGEKESFHGGGRIKGILSKGSEEPDYKEKYLHGGEVINCVGNGGRIPRLLYSQKGGGWQIGGERGEKKHLTCPGGRAGEEKNTEFLICRKLTSPRYKKETPSKGGCQEEGCETISQHQKDICLKKTESKRHPSP